MVTEVRIYYRGPRNAPGVSSIKLDLSAEEIVARPTVLRDIVHPYPDVFPSSGKIRCYSFEEVFAEKIRALGERCRPRDLYDVINLFRREDLHAEPSLIHEVLLRKCKSKEVEVPTFDALESSPNRPELESEWENMLAHQIRILPPIKEFWDALPHLFGWLGGTISKESLPPITLKEGTWVPSPTEWQRSNKRSLLEPIRFAAVNHLCVKLGYGNKFRLVEPYSLRTSKPGNLLFFAWKIPSQAIRSYRVDRIQSVEVTKQAFRPKFAIEFPSTGRLVAPPSVRRVKRRR